MQTQCFIIHIVVLVFIVSKLRLAHKSQIIAIPKSLAPFNSLVSFNPNSAGLLNVEKPSDKSVGTNRANQILTQTPLQILSHLFEKYLLQQQLTLALTYKLHTHTFTPAPTDVTLTSWPKVLRSANYKPIIFQFWFNRKYHQQRVEREARAHCNMSNAAPNNNNGLDQQQVGQVIF